MSCIFSANVFKLATCIVIYINIYYIYMSVEKRWVDHVILQVIIHSPVPYTTRLLWNSRQTCTHLPLLVLDIYTYIRLWCYVPFTQRQFLNIWVWYHTVKNHIILWGTNFHAFFTISNVKAWTIQILILLRPLKD